MYFRNYGLPKTWLDKYQKSIASEYPWTTNMVNRPKHCWNLNGGTFIRFIEAFLKSRSNFEHINTKMTLIANVFTKLRTSKKPVR